MFKKFFTTKPTTFSVTNTDTGRWLIVNNQSNAIVGDYGRKRDALRGAARKGLTIEGVRD